MFYVIRASNISDILLPRDFFSKDKQVEAILSGMNRNNIDLFCQRLDKNGVQENKPYSLSVTNCVAAELFVLLKVSKPSKLPDVAGKTRTVTNVILFDHSIQILEW